jgi:hypothetical protein
MNGPQPACKLPQAEKVLELLPGSRFHYLHQPETEIQARFTLNMMKTTKKVLCIRFFSLLL